MELFFCTTLQPDLIPLGGEESWHLVKVLRAQAGERVLLTDGEGTLATGEVSVPDPKSCIIRILSRQTEYGKRPYRLHLGVAPTKNIDRFEWFLEKATEIGVDDITPVLCEHSERKSVRDDRLRKIIQSAVKQSQQAYLPRLHPMLPLKQFLASAGQDDRFIAVTNSPAGADLQFLASPKKPAVVLIGPEGDFSPEETAAAEAAGFRRCSLGPSRLRTETAAVVACHTLSLVNRPR